MNKLIAIEIGNLGTTITGKTPSSNNPEDFGSEYMFITPSDSFDDKMIFKTNRYLSEVGINKLKNKVLPPKSVLVSCIGSAMGKIIMNHSSAISNQQINSIIINRSFDSDYIYYNLKNNYKLLRNAAAGSTALPMLNKTDFDKLVINIHKDLKDQQKISSVLSALDSKIELNNRINAELEAMAKTLYDYWFVQFDFPIYNQDGTLSGAEGYKTSGGTMIWNEELKRKIPEGWEDGTFENYCPSTGGFAFKSNWWTSEGVAVAKIKDIKENYTLDTSDLARIDMSDKEIDDKFLAKAGDVLIAMTGATVGKYAIVPITDYPIYVNQRVGYFSLGKDPTNLLPFLINSMNQSYFRYAIFTLANGAAQPNISNNQINSIQLLMPDKKLIEQYNEMFKP